MIKVAVCGANGKMGKTVVNAVENSGENINNGDYHRQRVNGAGVTLSAGVMKLNAEFCAVLVNSVSKLAHGLNVVVMAHCQLGVGRCCAVVVYAGYAGDDEADAALCALLVVSHQLLSGLTVCLTEADLCSAHDSAVFYCHGTDFHRGQQHFIAHVKTSFLLYSY